MSEVIAEHASGQQFFAGLLVLFAALAILLVAVGIYDVLSYLVMQRSREIGIRMSMGATRGSVIAMTLRRGMRLAAIGLAIGVVGTFAAGRVLASVLHEVCARDAWTMHLRFLQPWCWRPAICRRGGLQASIRGGIEAGVRTQAGWIFSAGKIGIAELPDAVDWERRGSFSPR